MNKAVWIKQGIALLITAGLVLLGVFGFAQTQYAMISAAIALVAVILVLLSYERSHTNLRRTVLIAVMTALSVLGRFLFAMVPGFKPMTAIIVLTGMYLGGEAGFLCGTFTAVLSNFYFGQGPWTPFQMFAFGFLGLLAGMLAGLLKKNVLLLCLYGIVAGALYSMIMDVWTILWAKESFDAVAYRLALLSALPFTIIYAASNVIFLLLMYRPFGRKMNRMIYKYHV